MRCRDAKRRLNDSGELDSELIEHLKDCPSCARDVEAGRILDSVFEIARDNADSDHTPFGIMKSKLETQSSRKNRKDFSIMGRIKYEISDHPRFSVGIIAAICLFAFVLLVPLSYEKTVGYDLSLSGKSAEDTADNNVAADIVSALGYGEAAFSFEVSGNLVNYHVSGIPSKEAAKEISSALTSLLSSIPEIIITPIIVEATGSIYAQARDKIDLKVQTKGKTDEEVKKELEEGLRKKGYKDPRVKVTSNADGERRIVIKNVNFSEGGDKTFQTMEMMELLVGEGGELEVKSPANVNLDIDAKGKTNEQIIKELKKKLAEKGINNPKITIKDLPDGKREINLEVDEEKKD